MNWKELPNILPGMRTWIAISHNYHFVISHENGKNLKENKKEWIGYTASFKSYEGRNKPAIIIDGLWQSFTAAEQACNNTLKQLKMKS